ARTPVSDLLPTRHGAEAGRVAGALALADVVRLSPEVVVAIARDGAGVHYPVPLVGGAGGAWRRAVAGDSAAAALVTHLTDPAAQGRLGDFDTRGWLLRPAGPAV